MCRICEELTDTELNQLIAAAKVEAKSVSAGGFDLTPTSRGHAVMFLRALSKVSGISPTDERSLAAWIANERESPAV